MEEQSKYNWETEGSEKKLPKEPAEKTDFKPLITLQNWKAKMAKEELEKKGIPVKIMSRGTGVAWNEIYGGSPSPAIYVPAFPLDIYVPENRMAESKEVLAGLNISEDDNETEIPETRPWQKIWATIALGMFILSIIMTLVAILRAKLY